MLHHHFKNLDYIYNSFQGNFSTELKTSDENLQDSDKSTKVTKKN